MNIDTREQYLNALRKGRLAYFSRVTRGKSGYILSLEDLSPQMEIVSEINVGYEKVPINRIIGTWSKARANMFTKNFLPLATSEKSEFALKWRNLYEAHITEGIRDPVKLYEYLNWYYVMEGNKRVSVLNYVKAQTVEAHVIRLLPRREPMTPEKKAYFDFLEFRNKTGIRDIWLDKEGGYDHLLKKFREYEPPENRLLENPNEYILKNIYLPFRDIFHDLGAQKRLRMTTGDAFLRFIEIFQMPEKIDHVKSRVEIKRLLEELILEETSVTVQTDTEEIIPKEKTAIKGITSFFGSKKPLKILFLHSRDPESSGWTHAHEQGRLFIQKEMEGRIETDYISGNFEDNKITYNTLEKGIKDGYDVIFATYPGFANPVLKASIRFPEVQYYLCSPEKSHQRVRTYFGQSFESGFLAGILAALLNRDGKIGYVATGSGVEPYFRINSFVQGARLINPDCRIPLIWNPFWFNAGNDKNLAGKMLENHCSLIFQHSLPEPGLKSKGFGLFDLSGPAEDPIRQYGYTQWNWGHLYLRIVENILSGYKQKDGYQQPLTGTVPLNFWGGLRSGTVDLKVSTETVPGRTRQLLKLMRMNLIHRQIHPFSGPIYDTDGNLRIPEGEQADLNALREMDWLCEGIIEVKGTPS